MRPENNQIIYLTLRHYWSGCEIEDTNSGKILACTGSRTFRSVRERWWFVAGSHCGEGKVAMRCVVCAIDDCVFLCVSLIFPPNFLSILCTLGGSPCCMSCPFSISRTSAAGILTTCQSCTCNCLVTEHVYFYCIVFFHILELYRAKRCPESQQ